MFRRARTSRNDGRRRAGGNGPSLLLGLATMAGAGCGADEAPGASLPLWPLSPEPELIVGELDGEPAYLFERLVDVARTSDGTLVVADGGLSVVRLFDGDGRFLVEIGREGQGPGEFTELTDVWLVEPDTIGVWDGGNARLSFFTSDGALVRDVPVTPGPDGADLGSFGLFVGAFADGGFALARIAGGARTPGTESADRMTVETFDRDGGFHGRLPTVDGMVRFGPGPLPFSTFPYFAAWDDRVFFTNGEGSVVTGYARDGGQVGTVSFPEPEHEIDAVMGALETTLRERDDEFQLTRLPDVPRPVTLPGIAQLIPGSGGELWTKRYDPTTDALWLGGGSRHHGGVWWVAGSDGRLLARVDMPDSFAPLHIGRSEIVGVLVDDFGVERVAVYRIERS